MDKEKSVQELLEKLNKEYPLTLHTGAGSLFTSVRRMKAEKEFGLPVNLRIGSVISVETGKAANEMNELEWESFYIDLSKQLKKDYPELYRQLFVVEEPKPKKTLFIFRWWFALLLSFIFFQMEHIFNLNTRIGEDLSSMTNILALVFLVIGVKDIFNKRKKQQSSNLTK